VSEREFGAAGRDPAGFGLSASAWNQLADYVGGALDGAQADEVRRRVVEDPAWEQAHSALTEATAVVRADLSAWGAAAEPMPDDVAGRLGRAIAEAGPGAGKAPPRLSDRAHRGPLHAVPTVPTEPGTPAPARRRPAARLWRAWAKPVAIAAGLLVVAGLGVNLLPTTRSAPDNATTAGGPAAAPQAAAPTLAQGAQPPIARRVASGTAYRRQNVIAGGRAALRSFASLQPVPGGSRDAESDQKTAAEPGPGRVPPELNRLTDPAALTGCLGEVTRAHGRAVTSVQLVDYATYEGTPALVLVFTDQDGRNQLWVTGPLCGLGGADSVLRATVE
jgi:hypothetical protein